MLSLISEVRYSCRTLARRPASSALAIAVLAVGVGATSLIFGALDAVLLRPLPYRDQKHLVFVESFQQENGHAGSASVADISDWRDRTRAFADLTAASPAKFAVAGTDEPEEIDGAYVLDRFWDTLGVLPSRGRIFTAADMRPGQNHVALISSRLWKRAFGGRPDALGTPVRVSGEMVVIIGIMPPGTGYPSNAEMWLPFTMQSERILVERDYRVYRAIGRLKPSTTIESARRELVQIAGELSSRYPATNLGSSVRITPMHDLIVGSTGRILLMIAGAVVIVFLIACTNASNLLLAEARRRQKEIAIRAALGARLGRLVRQLLVDSTLLSLAGSLLGLVLVRWGRLGLTALFPKQALLSGGIVIDGRLMVFTFLAALLTGGLAGTAPAIRVLSLDLNGALKATTRGTLDRGTRRFYAILTTAEFALALALLIGAGLMVQSLRRLGNVGLGFEPRDVLTMTLHLPRAMSPPLRSVRFREVLSAVRTTPGLISAAVVSSLPFQASMEVPVTVEKGSADGARAGGDVGYDVMSDRYFRTMGVPLLAGRDFTDDEASHKSDAVIVNRAFSRRFFGRLDTVGNRLRLADGPDSPWLVIVGVVGDVRHEELGASPRCEVYQPLGALPPFAVKVILKVRSPLGLAVIHDIKRKIWAIDREQPVADVEPMTALVARAAGPPRLYAIILAVLASVATLLAVGGIFGVVTYSLTQRIPEIGLRLTLGALPSDIAVMVMREVGSCVLVGSVLGVAVALALTRTIGAWLYGVGPYDVRTFAGSALVLVAAALLACYFPVRRAAHSDAVDALRFE